MRAGRNINLRRKSKTVVRPNSCVQHTSRCHPDGAVFWRRRTHATRWQRLHRRGLHRSSGLQKAQAIRMTGGVALPPRPAQTDDAQTIPDSSRATPD